MPLSKLTLLLVPVLLSGAAFSLASCNENTKVESSDNSSERHEEALAKFQEAQLSFKKLIATVRDEESFDTAHPGLDQVVVDFWEARFLFKKLTPPPEDYQVEIRKRISAGHKNTEPTSKDLMSLISIDSREEEVIAWLQDFTRAGHEVGMEMVRLYGESDYSKKANNPLTLENPKIDLSKIGEKEDETAGVSVFQWPDLEKNEPKFELKDLPKPAVEK